jgi:hypothetical protein
VLLVGSVLVWAATRHDAGTQLPAGPTPTSLGGPEVQGPGPASTLLTSWAEFPVGSSFVYADGRVIWGPNYDDRVPGYSWFAERHLNSAGLDLVRSGGLKAEDFVRGYVPPGLWADPQNAKYTASEYAACLWQQSEDYTHPFRDATNRRGDLPAPAQALLHTPRMFPPADDVHPWSACFALSLEEALAVLDLPGPRFEKSLEPRPLSGAFGAGGPWVVLIPASTGEGAIGLTVFQILPHGEPLLWDD